MQRGFMYKMKKTIVEDIIIAAFALVAVLGIFSTGLCRDRSAGKAEGEYYRAMEREYVREIRSLLEEKGYKDSGVTMTGVIGQDGIREYTVAIHHRRIGRLDDRQKSVLALQCQAVSFPGENCKFRLEFF